MAALQTRLTMQQTGSFNSSIRAITASTTMIYSPQRRNFPKSLRWHTFFEFLNREGDEASPIAVSDFQEVLHHFAAGIDEQFALLGVRLTEWFLHHRFNSSAGHA